MTDSIAFDPAAKAIRLAFDQKMMSSQTESPHVDRSSESTCLRCYPEGFCSWRYRVEGSEYDVRVTFHHFSEQGSIHISDKVFEIRKNGMFRGDWTLLHDDSEVASAKKLSAFSRQFELDAPGISSHAESYHLTPESSFGRSFQLRRSDKLIARICPEHAFTRRAVIEIQNATVDLPTVSFAFWLVVLTWIRAAQSG